MKRNPSELGRFLGAKFSTGIIKYPSGRFGIAGSVPLELCVEKNDYRGKTKQSRVFATEREAIDALLLIGIVHFQLSNCKFYDETKS